MNGLLEDLDETDRSIYFYSRSINFVVSFSSKSFMECIIDRQGGGGKNDTYNLRTSTDKCSPGDGSVLCLGLKVERCCCKHKAPISALNRTCCRCEAVSSFMITSLITSLMIKRSLAAECDLLSRFLWPASTDKRPEQS